MAASKSVVLTGASGHVGSHVLRQLCQSDDRHSVTALVASEGDGEKLRNKLTECEFTVHCTDLMDKEKLADQLKDSQCVIHCGHGEPNNVDDALTNSAGLVEEPVTALKNVLAVCKETDSIKRVVVVGSALSCRTGHGKKKKATATDEDLASADQACSLYAKGHILAEQASKDFVKVEGEEAAPFELVYLLPAFPVGPVLVDTAQSVSFELLKYFLDSSTSRVPRLKMSTVDVRDLAAAVAKAVTAEGVAGQRLLLSSGQTTLPTLGSILNEEFSAKGYKIPLKPIPRFLNKISGVLRRDTRFMFSMLSGECDYDSKRSMELLGLEELREPKTGLLDLAHDLIELNYVSRSPSHTVKRSQSAPSRERLARFRAKLTRRKSEGEIDKAEEQNGAADVSKAADAEGPADKIEVNVIKDETNVEEKNEGDTHAKKVTTEKITEMKVESADGSSSTTVTRTVVTSSQSSSSKTTVLLSADQPKSDNEPSSEPDKKADDDKTPADQETAAGQSETAPNGETTASGKTAANSEPAPDDTTAERDVANESTGQEEKEQKEAAE